MAKQIKKSVPAAGRRVTKSHNRPPKGNVVQFPKNALATVAKEAWRFARGETNMLDALKAAADPKVTFNEQAELKDRFFDGHMTNSLFRSATTFTAAHEAEARRVRGLKGHKKAMSDKENIAAGRRTQAQELAYGAARTALTRLIEKAEILGIKIGAAIKNPDRSEATKEAAKTRAPRASKANQAKAGETPTPSSEIVSEAVKPSEITSLGQVIHQVKFAATALDRYVTTAAQNKELKVPGELIRTVHEFLAFAKALPSDEETAEVEAPAEPAKAPAKAAPRKRRA
jgi:hypothetical protein